MVDPLVFDFLTQLKANNNRDWFNDNKAFFNEAKASFEQSMQQFIEIVHTIDPSIGDLSPKECVFRIYRDTRFSKDKTPYKTNMGGFVAKGGRKSTLAGYYLHVEPGASMVAGGSYCPPADVLKAIRREIYNFADEYKAIIHDKTFTKVFPEMFEDKLKMAPKGFPKNFEDIELLKYKSFAPLHAAADEDLTGPGAADHVRYIIQVLEPHNTFINRGIEAEEDEIIL
ncbi:DUF2461 domain-containing protein [Carboxylicivirga mesophila]|uniref:DUF2461 domain-containing protein n=1 Tax=Carboxylicivirga mesophila TaxID=1166478 RepID=A0ABS5KDA3_9BACT|nr:DUF2461 domain-containing protein [Carboxylicivirga mesophila]MBS2213005.1 DUF2461 domain-containing protein [Carboxylicivirga mesophila]